ncbi:UNVERIFIED_CONTAM: hypothetical protein FKN15_012041 [Acipenser sinensis]
MADKLSKKYEQHFRETWLKEDDFKLWLKSVPGMANKAYCKLCKTTLNAKKSDLIKHANTAKHIECTKPFTDTRQKQAFLALYVAEHSAVRSVDHLTELCRARFKDSHAPALKLHRSKCTAIINNVLGPHFVSELVADVGESTYITSCGNMWITLRNSGVK